MPSVPKYFRTIFPNPGKGRAFQQNDRPIARNLQKERAISAPMAKAAIGRNRGGRDGGGLLFSYFRLLSPRVGAGCVTLTGSEAGKLSSRPRSSDRSSLRLRASSRSRLLLSSRSSTTVRFGMAMDVLLASDAPGKRRTGRAIVQTTHGA